MAKGALNRSTQIGLFSIWPRLSASFGRRIRCCLPSSQRKSTLRTALLQGGRQRRSIAQWKELRRCTTTEVKALLAEQKPVPAIKKLSRAMVEDPQHPAYHELLRKAVAQRRKLRLKGNINDPWADLPDDLKQESLQLEAFSAYVDELEHLFDKAGIPPLMAPPPPRERKARKSKVESAQASIEE